MNNDEHSSYSLMSKLGDVGDQIPDVYHISKYNRMGTESNQNCKQKHIR